MLMFKSSLGKPLAGLCLATALLVQPLASLSAYAGNIGFTVSPKGDEAKALQTGLKLYSLAKDLKRKNRARVDQVGSGNSGAVTQNGQSNWGRVFQRGRNNTGAVTQNGNSNSFALFQFGKNNTSSHTQAGNSQASARFELGW